MRVVMSLNSFLFSNDSRFRLSKFIFFKKLISYFSKYHIVIYCHILSKYMDILIFSKSSFDVQAKFNMLFCLGPDGSCAQREVLVVGASGAKACDVAATTGGQS